MLSFFYPNRVTLHGIQIYTDKILYLYFCHFPLFWPQFHDDQTNGNGQNDFWSWFYVDLHYTFSWKSTFSEFLFWQRWHIRLNYVYINILLSLANLAKQDTFVEISYIWGFLMTMICTDTHGWRKGGEQWSELVSVLKKNSTPQCSLLLFIFPACLAMNYLVSLCWEVTHCAALDSQ